MDGYETDTRETEIRKPLTEGIGDSSYSCTKNRGEWWCKDWMYHSRVLTELIIFSEGPELDVRLGQNMNPVGIK